MRVLLIEGQEGAARGARDTLVGAGHDVTTCHEDGQPLFPCKGLGDAGCPLDAEPVDAALVVRSAVAPEQLPSEVGVSCALRRHIPLVSLGGSDSPFTGFATELVASAEQVLAAVERAARAPLARHTAVACEALRRVLDRHDRTDVEATGRVERSGRSLRVRLMTSDPVPTAVREQAAVAALSAVRTIDHDAAIISVGIEP